MWERLKNRLFKIYLNYKYRSSKLRSHIRKNKIDSRGYKANIGQHSRGQSFSKGDNPRIKVAALQVKMELFNDPLKFAGKMEKMICRAAGQGVRLVVFPEDNLSQLLGLLPGLSGDNNEKGIDNETSGVDMDEIISEFENDISISDILAFIGPFIRKISLIIFSELARKYNVFIMTGSGLFPEEGKYIDKYGLDKADSIKDLDRKTIYNIAYLFGPDGELLGGQKKNHLLPLEESWGLATGDGLSVYPTEIGRLAFPICMDATYFETFQIAFNKGAEIVMIPIANPDPDYNYWTALRGIWGRVQENPVYGIKSAMVGDFLGIKLTGQAGIYAPIPLTANNDGIIAESDSYDSEEIVIAEIDLNILREYRKMIRSEENKSFKNRYFPAIYKNI